MAESTTEKEFTFKFLRGADAGNPSLDWTTGPEYVRKAVGEALNARNC